MANKYDTILGEYREEDGGADASGALTQFTGNGNWKVWYSDGSGDVVELALGADGTFLKSNGASSAPSFATPAGSGDVSKVGTPVNNQIGVWTGDGTLEGDANLTYDGTALALGASKNITMTGDISSSGSRVGTGYFTNLNVGSSGTLSFVTLGSKNISINQATISFNDQSDGNAVRLVGSSTTGANQTITLPDATGTVMLTSAIGSTVQAYDADLTTWGGITPGTGVGTALAINVGSAGAFVTFNGALGTPSSGVATNLTGTASGLTAGNVTTNANLTGHVTSVGNAAVLGSFTKAQLSTAVSDGDPLYVGDVTTNATHTGDATGSGALTVVAINGTTLSGLATGILKNTTGTGVPSIAVAGDFPTLNQNTTGSAATLTTSRNIGGNPFNGSADITVASATAGFTISGGNLLMGTNNITLTGSIASTGSRATKVWTVDLESTNMPTVGGTSLSSTFQGLDTQLTSLAALAYTGNAGKFIRVNAGETDFELAAVSGSGTVTSVAMTVPTGLTISGSPVTTTGTLAVALDTGYVIPLQTTLDGKANTALSNLASVAINTTLVSDTDNTDALGTTAIAWSDLFLGSGAVITFNSAPSTADVTITHSADTLTFAGGTIALGTATATGGLTGNVTGNVSGSAATVTSAAQTAITTLANLVSVQGLTVTLADAGADALLGWDDSASAYQNLSAADVRTALGLVIGTNVQAYDADLTTWAGITPGTGVGTALAINVGSAGAFVTFNGALGTPSSGTLTNATGLPLTGLVSDTTTALGIGSINLGHASDTTFARVSAGVVSIEGINILTTATGLPLAGGTMTGNITLAENTSIALDPAGSADGKYTGITVTGTGGATIAFGDLVTLDKDDSRWELVDISVAAAATGDARGIIGIAATSSTDGGAITVLLNGIIRADANFPALTIGAAVYASTTGDIVVTQPTTTDHVIRVVGYALTADEIYFNPENDWISHT